jgi:uncharacterized protein YkwD
MGNPFLHKPAAYMLAAAVASILFLSLPAILLQPKLNQDYVLGEGTRQLEIVFPKIGNKETLTPQVLAAVPTPQILTKDSTLTPSPIVPQPKPEVFTKPQTQTWEESLVALTNQARVANGLTALKVDTQLTNLARARSNDMATKNYFSHTSPTGETAFTLLAGKGISYKKAGENIGKNTYPDPTTATTAFETWMGSAGHKANILSKDFTSIGIGAAVNANGMKYYTQIFIGN